jgi:hypothetical protein
MQRRINQRRGEQGAEHWIFVRLRRSRYPTKLQFSNVIRELGNALHGMDK